MPQPANSNSFERFRKREGTVVDLGPGAGRWRRKMMSNCDSRKVGGAYGSARSFHMYIVD